METSGCNFTNSQKESCAVSLMRDTIEELSVRDGISYENALLCFATSKVYGFRNMIIMWLWNWQSSCRNEY